MLKDRILLTLKFFDLQDVPLTLLELHRYLITDLSVLRGLIDKQGEVVGESEIPPTLVTIDQILECLETSCTKEVEECSGFYVLRGRSSQVLRRLKNYCYGIVREKKIKKFALWLKFIPFVRGVALGGSQAMGMPKETSDMDLFIITDGNFLWLARTLVTAFFHIFGIRRHGSLVANRFCLNHYISSPREVLEYKNLYKAAEYAKLRPLVYESIIRRFQYNNLGWISQLFPNASIKKISPEKQSWQQRFFEQLFDNFLGKWVEQKLKAAQLPRIRQAEKFIVVRDDELSFHPQSKQQPLLEAFLG